MKSEKVRGARATTVQDNSGRNARQQGQRCSRGTDSAGTVRWQPGHGKLQHELEQSDPKRVGATVQGGTENSRRGKLRRSKNKVNEAEGKQDQKQQGNGEWEETAEEIRRRWELPRRKTTQKKAKHKT